jgi:hypothetical protein
VIFEDGKMDELSSNETYSTSHEPSFRAPEVVREREVLSASAHPGTPVQSERQNDEDVNGFVLGYN